MNLEQFPERLRQSMQAYVENGQPVGDFLLAVLSNNLCEAYGRADDENAGLMREYVLWLYNDVPHAAQGSRAAVAQWIKDGGLRGRMADARGAAFDGAEYMMEDR